VRSPSTTDETSSAAPTATAEDGQSHCEVVATADRCTSAATRQSMLTPASAAIRAPHRWFEESGAMVGGLRRIAAVAVRGGVMVTGGRTRRAFERPPTRLIRVLAPRQPFGPLGGLRQ
jgi:hypothetical protein